MRHVLRNASEKDLAMVWTAVRPARIFDTREELDSFFREAPWRIQVTDSGEAAVLERWREHLDILSVRGLWCAERRIGAVMTTLDEVASRQGFSDLLSPVVPESREEPYVSAGMTPFQRIVSMRLDRLQRAELAPPEAPADVTLRLGAREDLEAVLAADMQAFDTFWRGDVPTVDRYLSTGRVMMAEARGKVIGYTLATVERGDGMLGRLAVVPAWQGRGVGTLLLYDALEYLVRAGAHTAMLCTQEGNATSRSLYGRAGFREVGETSVFLAFGRTPETRAG